VSRGTSATAGRDIATTRTPPVVCRSAPTIVAKVMGCALHPEFVAALEATRPTVPTVGPSVRGLCFRVKVSPAHAT